jgi:adenine-specific DNA-methyltransferase
MSEPVKSNLIMSINKKKYNEDEIVACRIINGDCSDVLRAEDSGKYDLILTSPPYNVGKSYEKKTSMEKYQKDHEKIIEQLVRVLSINGNICWQVGTFVDKGEVVPLDIFYYAIFKRHGLKLRNRIVWHYGHGLHSTHRFSGRYETILWFTKSEDYIFNLDTVRVPSKYPNKKHYKGGKRGELSGNPLGKNPSDVWEIVKSDWDSGLWNIPNVKARHPEKTDHPCQFPIELVERCVLALSKESSWVLDPFAGVGSTIIGAIKNHRNAVGIEKEMKFCNITLQRISEFKNGSLKIRPVNRLIHQAPIRAEKPGLYRRVINTSYTPSKNQKETKTMAERKQNFNSHSHTEYLGQSIIHEMVAGGATKVAIAKAVGVTDMTILSVSQGKTKTFRKLKKLQSVHDRWKAGKLDLSGKRGKKDVEASEAEDFPVRMQVSAGKKATDLNKAQEIKSKVARKPVPYVKAKRSGRPRKDAHVSVSTGFQLPDVTEEMVAEVEEQIRRLQAEAKYLRDLIAIRKKYGR